jgi:hypothetical protein
MQYSVDPDRHKKIFGHREDRAPGRYRACKTCGGEHRLDQPWPHNCRKPAPPRNRDLSTPQITPPFQAFRTGLLDTAETIGSRHEKREYMARNDLVEFDEGITKDDDHWTYDYKVDREIVSDIKRFIETDPLNIPPDLKAAPMEAGDLDDGTEIDASDIEIIE